MKQTGAGGPPRQNVTPETATNHPDYHTHTSFSCDSQASMEAICEAALREGMQEIAITDHADFEPLDFCCGHFRPTDYWQAIRRCRDLFEGRLIIRAGVECGEAHLYQQEVAAVLSADEYDFVLGSLHWADGRPTFDGVFFDGLDLDEGLVLYFDASTHLAAEGDYDVLAHPDIIRRAVYHRFGLVELDLAPHEARVRRMLRIVAERGKGLEVNTAPRRRGMGEPGPSAQVLSWFWEEGGRIVTLGSDAHRPESVGADFDRAVAIARQAGIERFATFERRRVAGW
ncbi:MAG: histidinol-phosphatase HisJ family protein [Anaerolineae bacterium]